MKNLGKVLLVVLMIFAALRWPYGAKASGNNYICGTAYYEQEYVCEQAMYECTEDCHGYQNQLWCWQVMVETGQSVYVNSKLEALYAPGVQCFNAPSNGCMQTCISDIDQCMI